MDTAPSTWSHEDGVLIEIQLRTEIQHTWAELVQRLDRSLGTRLKAGQADPSVRVALVRGSEIMAAFERGEIDRAATMTALQAVTAPADH